MKPELTTAELSEIQQDEARGLDVPDVNSPAQVDCWRTEREPEAS